MKSNSEIINDVVEWYEGIPVEDQLEFKDVTSDVIKELLSETNA